MNIIKINNLDQHLLPANHRATAYGDGVFETMRARHGEIVAIDLHLKRITKGVEVLNLAVLPSQWQALDAELRKLAAECIDIHVIKVMLLRNAAGRGYDFDPTTQDIDIVIQCAPYTVADYSGRYRIKLAENAITENASLAGIKHLNRLDSVLAKQSARRQGVEDCLLCTADGHIVEATSSNVFFKLGEKWLTPEITRAGVLGIARQRLLSEFPKSLAVQNIHTSQLSNVSAAFVCNSLTGCIPVTSIEQYRLKVSDDMAHFQDFLRG